MKAQKLHHVRGHYLGFLVPAGWEGDDLIDDEDDWPSDMLLRIAGDLGFGDELEDVIDNA